MVVNITFRALTQTDLVLLHQWFHVSHVKKWYARGEDYTIEMIQEKYLPRIKNPEQIPNYLILDHNTPVGYIQLYYLTESLPDGVLDYNHPIFKSYSSNRIAGIDMFIAEESILKTGIGSLALNQFISEKINDNINCVVVDPRVDNANTIAFFKKNGFNEFPSPLNSQYLLLARKLDTPP